MKDADLLTHLRGLGLITREELRVATGLARSTIQRAEDPTDVSVSDEVREQVKSALLVAGLSVGVKKAGVQTFHLDQAKLAKWKAAHEERKR